mmetsp:Transcript_175/g.211  ORF Transcript_175/g.211 Transcript_175/m.211 type:complete len:279 (-) Transcript_175:101-937(-)
MERVTYWEAIKANRSHASKLLSNGTKGDELFEKMATLSIDHRLKDRSHRCLKCWYCSLRCVCDKMPNKISSNDLPNVSILLLMHHKEYLNAGNSAKSLLALLPKKCINLYVYGREGDFNECLNEMLVDREHTMILWPGKESLTIDDFINSLPATSGWRTTNDEDSDSYNNQKKLLIVALDGTYTNAKNMAKSIKRRLSDLSPACVALHPTSVSRFHRAKKSYSAAIQDSIHKNTLLDKRALRVSTAEACALLLKELGASTDVEEKIMQALLINNIKKS